MNCPQILISGRICGMPTEVRGSVGGMGLVSRRRVCQGIPSHEFFTEEKPGNRRVWNRLRAEAMRKARANVVNSSHKSLA